MTMTMTPHPQLETELRRLGCYADHALAETAALEKWCQLGSDVAIAFTFGFLFIAMMTW